MKAQPPEVEIRIRWSLISQVYIAVTANPNYRSSGGTPKEARGRLLARIARSLEFRL